MYMYVITESYQKKESLLHICTHVRGNGILPKEGETYVCVCTYGS